MRFARAMAKVLVHAVTVNIILVLLRTELDRHVLHLCETCFRVEAQANENY